MSYSALIDRIKLRIQDLTHATDFPITLPPLATITHAEVDLLEAKLGFQIPVLLRTLYTEVANGHFGPEYGISGIHNRLTEAEKIKATELKQVNVEKEKKKKVMYYFPEIPRVYDFYKSVKSQFGDEWPVGLVPFVTLDREDIDCIDCTTAEGAIIYFVAGWSFDEPSLSELLLPVASSLEEYLETWLSSKTGHHVARYNAFDNSSLYEKSLLY
jgi:SMI1 / KNR4 family (SUKH-1)